MRGDGVVFERFPCLDGTVDELPVPCGSHPEFGQDGFFLLAGPGWVCCFEVEQLLRVDHEPMIARATDIESVALRSAGSGLRRDDDDRDDCEGNDDVHPHHLLSRLGGPRRCRIVGTSYEVHLLGLGFGPPSWWSITILPGGSQPYIFTICDRLFAHPSPQLFAWRVENAVQVGVDAAWWWSGTV